MRGTRNWLRDLWRGVRRVSVRVPKRLRVCESLPLGERRFVAVVEFEGERFLVGGTASSLVLLAPLAGSREKQDAAQSRVNALWSGGVENDYRDEAC